MGKRIEGKHIKHSSNLKPFTETENKSIFLIKSSTPYISALKQITKLLNNFTKSKNVKKFQNESFKNVKYVTVKGMSKTIEKTLNLAIHFQDKNYKVDILTGSVKVLDEFVPTKNVPEEEEDEDDDRIYQKRMVSSIEVRIWIRRDQ
ncbi:POP7 Ribonucleases P/MRP protein subunit POP7 [Candida maltosa Xu316]|uniref:Uncharacterized protein n=1 Tax=Candida maltosa (strain Xu316) TaxID=1245528 RepID=M3J8N5_CANMX|nr:hypothetical protein G210_0963 [Candida maltosa Xu316]